MSRCATFVHQTKLGPSEFLYCARQLNSNCPGAANVWYLYSAPSVDL
jgi:hypothetical protein